MAEAPSVAPERPIPPLVADVGAGPSCRPNMAQDVVNCLPDALAAPLRFWFRCYGVRAASVSMIYACQKMLSTGMIYAYGTNDTFTLLMHVRSRHHFKVKSADSGLFAGDLQDAPGAACPCRAPSTVKQRERTQARMPPQPPEEMGAACRCPGVFVGMRGDVLKTKNLTPA
jgi:hypothetical protein